MNRSFSATPEKLFIFIALLFGIFSAFTVPQLSVNDETAHFYRAYSISRGSITETQCFYPQEIIDKVNDARKGVHSFDIPEKNSSNLVSGSCGAAGNYYPTMHLPQSLGILFAKVVYNSPDFMVLAGRLANLVFFTISMYFIIRFVKIGKWVFFVLGLLPTSIHAAASLSYDTFNFIAILAFVALILNLVIQKTTITRRQLSALTILALLMVTAKTSNAVLLLLLTTLPLSLFNDSYSKQSSLIKKILLIGAITFASFISIYLWQSISNSTIPEIGTTNRVSENPLYFFVILYNTYINPFLGYSDIITRGVVGEFSSFKYHLPSYLVIASYLLFSFSLFAKEKYANNFWSKSFKNLAFLCAATLVLSIIIITYGLYTLWATQPERLGPNAIYADGVQGRYFTPLLALFIPIGLWLRRYIFIATSSTTIHNGAIVASSVSLLLFYSFQTILFIK